MIKKYNTRTETGIDYVKHGVAACDGGVLTPGSVVFYTGHPTSRGIVIAVTDDVLTVLWSVEPDFSAYKFPLPPLRRIGPQNLISIQPMSIPNGGIFYLNYKYGEKTEPSGSV